MFRINELRIVDSLKEALGEETSRKYTQTLASELEPLVSETELESLLARMFAEQEARMWKIAAAIITANASLIGVGVGLILAFN